MVAGAETEVFHETGVSRETGVFRETGVTEGREAAVGTGAKDGTVAKDGTGAKDGTAVRDGRAGPRRSRTSSQSERDGTTIGGRPAVRHQVRESWHRASQHFQQIVKILRAHNEAEQQRCFLLWEN